MNEQSRSGDIIEQLERLSSHQQFVYRLREISPDILGGSILEKATYLLAAITDFLRISLIYLTEHYIMKVLKGIAGEDVTAGKKSLESALGEFDLAVDREINLIILKRQEDQENQNTLSWLSTLDFEKKHNDVRNRRLEKTGQWLLRDSTFVKWLDEDPSTLWCPGLREETFRFETR